VWHGPNNPLSLYWFQPAVCLNLNQYSRQLLVRIPSVGCHIYLRTLLRGDRGSEKSRWSQTLSGWVMLGWTQRGRTRRMQQERFTQALYQESAPGSCPQCPGLSIWIGGELTAAVVVHTPGSNLRAGEWNCLITEVWLFIVCRCMAAIAKKAAALEPANPHPMVALAIAHRGHASRTAAQLPIVRHSI